MVFIPLYRNGLSDLSYVIGLFWSITERVPPKRIRPGGDSLLGTLLESPRTAPGGR